MTAAQREPVKRGISPGLKYMAWGAVFFSLMSVCVKLASETLPSSHTVMARGVVTLVMSYAALRYPRSQPRLSLWGVDKKRLLLRGFAGFVALNCYYYTLKTLPLAEATVIQYTSPIFTTVLAAAVLGEGFTLRDFGLVLLSFLGVILVVRPEGLFHAHGVAVDTHSYAIALLGAVVSSIAYVTIRKLRATDDPAVIVFYFPLVAVPLSIPALLRDLTMPTPFGWLLLLLLGIFTQIAQVFMTRSLHAETAGRAMNVSYLQVVLAHVWGIVLFGEHPTLLGLAGALLIFGPLMLLARRPLEKNVAEG